MNILLLASHAVAEYDDLRMFTDMGFDCFAPGGYEVPSRSGEGIRPALPDAPHHPEFVELCNAQRADWGEPGSMIDWAKAKIPDPIIDWADVIIAHHFVDRWISGQWDRIKHKRVIWRTCGQSNAALEDYMAPLREDGLQVVRYSPAERRHFERLGSFAGEDALIRFGKYPDDYANDYAPWTGSTVVVGNITQDMAARGDACGYGFWQAATEGLPVMPAGPGSENMRDGMGPLPYEAMLEYLRNLRAYLYTGTRPASYTLGLIEAMLSGTPVVCIAPKVWGDGWDGEDLFEGSDIVGYGPNGWGEGAIRTAHDMLSDLLDKPERAARQSVRMRARAIDLFGIDKVSDQWREFLS